MLRVSHFLLSSNTANVRAACKDLIRAIDQLKQTYDRYAADPAIATLLSRTTIDLSVEDLAGLNRDFLTKQIEKCLDKTMNASGPDWGKWIRDLARICPKIGIAPSGEGPERNAEDQSSKFVRLARRLQAELPEICAEHESNSKSSDASFAKAVRRALSAREAEPLI